MQATRFTIKAALALTAALALVSVPGERLRAQPPSPQTPAVPEGRIAATDATGLVRALKAAGYEDAEFVAREGEDELAFVRFTANDLTSNILFTDCDEAVPDFCETLVLSTSWNRTTPMTAEAVASANREYRYISIWCDDDGDPYAQWAVFTGRDGIPASVFLKALERYTDVVYDFWDVVFDGDEENPMKVAETDAADQGFNP